MPVPKTITKQNIIDAVEEVRINGVPPGRQSRHYNLIVNEQRFPPKYVISVAYKFISGEYLPSNDFIATEAVNYLKKLGFEIKKESTTLPSNNFWIEKTLVKERSDRLYGDRAVGKAMWSPIRSKNGADVYKNMRQVKPGDIVLHLTDNEGFSGISVVESGASETTGIAGTDWDGPCYLIKLKDYVKFEQIVPRDQILNDINRARLDLISEKSEVFYNRKLELRQGAYITPCPIELLEIINEKYISNVHNDLPFVGPTTQLIKDRMTTGNFDLNSFAQDIQESGLLFGRKILGRFVASLITKPFVILTGLSGSGKTKLAQAFAQWICQDKEQYCLLPVGADWTNREPILGFPNALDKDNYVKPDNGALDLLINSNKNPDLPYFLILDEMNLSHVERYFADFLSVMESGDEISLFSNSQPHNGIPAKLKLPSNLFIIGTVNIDETTYMFSPKVLDRANTIEFRVSKEEISRFLDKINVVDMNILKGKGANLASSFLNLARRLDFKELDTILVNKTLVSFFNQLKKTGAEFGYRSASEIHRLINQLSIIYPEITDNEKIDIAIIQKLLPKLHGSRRKLTPVLKTIAGFCVTDRIKDVEKEVLGIEEFDYNSKESVIYPLSLEKIARMYKGAMDNGFASFAEA